MFSYPLKRALRAEFLCNILSQRCPKQINIFIVLSCFFILFYLLSEFYRKNLFQNIPFYCKPIKHAELEGQIVSETWFEFYSALVLREVAIDR